MCQTGRFDEQDQSRSVSGLQATERTVHNLLGYPSSDTRYFERMCEPSPYCSVLRNCEDLRFLLKPPEGTGIQHACSVTQRLLVNLTRIWDGRFSSIPFSSD